MHRGVLAHLELGEVEAERAQQPDDVLELTVRGAGVPRRDEGLLHEDEVLQGLVRPGVGHPGPLLAGRLEPGRDDEAASGGAAPGGSPS